MNNSFIFRLNHYKDILLFNCSESLQSYIISKQIRMNNVAKIIITDLHIRNISGLLGLLSSLNSIGRIKDLHIYGPRGLSSYLDLGKKYSHTNFKYILYIHTLSNGLIIKHEKYRIYTFINNYSFDFLIIASELAGTFIIQKANNHYLYPGPLYSKLKKGSTFILPDGLILNGSNFTISNSEGIKFNFIFNSYYSRKSIQNNIKSMILLYQ
uniref:Ribonuclease Z n=1 Tax=Sphondylothamnion multifidum TaxID=193186 RepID=A0A4D6WYJ9_9FLOR|nr:ribonuclease Z [Sphondylothamnion multifidum]